MLLLDANCTSPGWEDDITGGFAGVGVLKEIAAEEISGSESKNARDSREIAFFMIFSFGR